MHYPKILISACLVGQPVRYNGSAKMLAHAQIEQWQREGRLVAVCPEVSIGFTTPRPPAEIMHAKDGDLVLSRQATVVDKSGLDVTDMFIDAAYKTLEIAIKNDCKFALFTDASPSCGSRWIYDGSFSCVKHIGTGVTTALLTQHQIQVFPESQLEMLYQLIG